MFKHSALMLAVAVMILSAGTIAWSQDAAADAAKQEAKQEPSSTSVAPASVEITPDTIDAHVGEKIKFSATAKDAAGNTIDEKPSVWFAAPFDLAGADESGEVTFHAPGVVTVGAVIAGKTGYATVNVGNSKIASLEIEPRLPDHGRRRGKAYGHRAHGQWQSALRCGNQVDVGKTTIASVDAAGLVTGLAPGSVTIKATSEGVSGTVTFQVVRDAVAS